VISFDATIKENVLFEFAVCGALPKINLKLLL
jgi:hypothetical protein